MLQINNFITVEIYIVSTFGIRKSQAFVNSVHIRRRASCAWFSILQGNTEKIGADTAHIFSFTTDFHYVVLESKSIVAR
jgi:hypothetical protein